MTTQSPNLTFKVLATLIVIGFVGYGWLNWLQPHLIGGRAIENIDRISTTPLDATTLAGNDALYFLDAGNLRGQLGVGHFSAYDDLVAENAIRPDATIYTDQSFPVNTSDLVTGVQTGLGLAGGGVGGVVSVSLVPGQGIVLTRSGQVAAVLGDLVDLGSETEGLLSITRGGLGRSELLPAGQMLVSTGSGYSGAILAAGDGLSLTHNGALQRFALDTTVCRTSGNCTGVGGGVIGVGTSNHLARFTASGQIGDSLIVDNGTSVGIGTTDLTGALTVEAQQAVVLPANLLANGNLNIDSNGWDVGGCGTHAGGQITVTYSASCTGSGWPTISTTFSSQANTLYEITFEVTAINGDQPYIYFANTSGYHGPYAVGTHTETIRMFSVGTETLYFESWNWNTNTSWSIDNISVKQVAVGPAIVVRGADAPVAALKVEGDLEVEGDTTLTGDHSVTGTLQVKATDTTNAGTYRSQTNSLIILPSADGNGYYQGLNFTSSVAFGNPYAVNAVHGIAGTASNGGTGAISALNGLHLYSSNYGNAPISYLRGQFLTASSSQGTINNLMGVELNSTATGGVVTNQKGLNLFVKSSGAEVTNRHGLYINSMSGVATGQDYAIYSAASQTSYLSGSLGVGTASPDAKLTVRSANNSASTSILSLFQNNMVDGLRLTSVGITKESSVASTPFYLNAGTTANISLQSNSTGRVLVGFGSGSGSGGERLQVKGLSGGNLLGLYDENNESRVYINEFGSLYLRSGSANSTTTQMTSPVIKLERTYWNGSSSTREGLTLKLVNQSASEGQFWGWLVGDDGAVALSTSGAGGFTSVGYDFPSVAQATSLGQFHVRPKLATTPGLTVRGIAGQTADLFQVQVEGGTPMFRVDSDGGLKAEAGISIGSGGTAILEHVSATTTWDPESVTSGSSTSTTIAVSGAEVGDVVTAGFSQPVVAGLVMTGSVTASGTVTVTLGNLSGDPQDLPSGTLRVTVSKY